MNITIIGLSEAHSERMQRELLLADHLSRDDEQRLTHAVAQLRRADLPDEERVFYTQEWRSLTADGRTEEEIGVDRDQWAKENPMSPVRLAEERSRREPSDDECDALLLAMGHPAAHAIERERQERRQDSRRADLADPARRRSQTELADLQLHARMGLPLSHEERRAVEAADEEDREAAAREGYSRELADATAETKKLVALVEKRRRRQQRPRRERAGVVLPTSK